MENTRSNDIMVVGSCKFIANLLKVSNDNLYLAIGTGDPSWDDGDLPTPLPNRTSLVNEVYRKQIDISTAVFVEPDDISVVSNIPTKVIRLEIEVEGQEFSGDVREQGIFGINATDELNSGVMIEYSNYDKIELPSNLNAKIFAYLSW